MIDSAGTSPEGESIAELFILTPNLSAAEIAAVTVVVRAAAAAEESLRQDSEEESSPAGWNSGTMRQLRGEIRPGPRQWGRAL